MSSTEAINDITIEIAKFLQANLDENNKLTTSEFGQRCAKIFREFYISSKTDIKEEKKKEKKKRSPSKYNLYIKEQIKLKKIEDSEKPKEERRSSQLMMKEIAKKWKEGDKDIYNSD